MNTKEITPDVDAATGCADDQSELGAIVGTLLEMSDPTQTTEHDLVCNADKSTPRYEGSGCSCRGREERAGLTLDAPHQRTAPLPELAQRLYRAICSFERADAEYRRARDAGAQPRLSTAGTAYQMAKARLFKSAKEYAIYG